MSDHKRECVDTFKKITGNKIAVSDHLAGVLDDIGVGPLSAARDGGSSPYRATPQLHETFALLNTSLMLFEKVWTDKLRIHSKKYGEVYDRIEACDPQGTTDWRWENISRDIARESASPEARAHFAGMEKLYDHVYRNGGEPLAYYLSASYGDQRLPASRIKPDANPYDDLLNFFQDLNGTQERLQAGEQTPAKIKIRQSIDGKDLAPKRDSLLKAAEDWRDKLISGQSEHGEAISEEMKPTMDVAIQLASAACEKIKALSISQDVSRAH